MGAPEHPMSQPDQSVEGGLGGFPRRQMGDLSHDDAAAVSAPGWGWHGYHQHTQRAILGGLNGDNGWFCSSDAVIDGGFFSPISFLHAEIITCLCVAPNASVTFSSG